MPRRNRVDPSGDLHAVADRGLFTGNRGCLLDDDGRGPVRHHRGTLWIICHTSYRGWRHPLDAPRTWTPLFFLDDAVALAAGHRPCGLCRRDEYLAYRHGVTVATESDRPVLAGELNRRLAAERLRRGRGIDRAADRRWWPASAAELPTGTVVRVADNGPPVLLTEHHAQPFGFDRWGEPVGRPTGDVSVLTPPTSVAALRNGFEPVLHPSASRSTG
ncbi:MAG: hypothetical protein AAF531_07610 [Actinomycetota bacterium]